MYQYRIFKTRTERVVFCVLFSSCQFIFRIWLKCFLHRELENIYRYFIASREIYHNVCPEVPGNPRDVNIFPDAEGREKYNISGIPGNPGTNILVYFPRSNEITVMLHFTRENAWKIDPNSRGKVTLADSRDVMNNVACTIKCPSLFQSDVLSIPKISAVNITSRSIWCVNVYVKSKQFKISYEIFCRKKSLKM